MWKSQLCQVPRAPTKVFCLSGHYRLVTPHWLHTASLGSTMGETMGGEVATVQLWHPKQGVGELSFAQHAGVLLPAACWQE